MLGSCHNHATDVLILEDTPHVDGALGSHAANFLQLLADRLALLIVYFADVFELRILHGGQLGGKIRPAATGADQCQDNFIVCARSGRKRHRRSSQNAPSADTIHATQNTSFKPNWISRGEVAPEMTPNCELFSVPFGLLKFG